MYKIERGHASGLPGLAKAPFLDGLALRGYFSAYVFDIDISTDIHYLWTVLPLKPASLFYTHHRFECWPLIGVSAPQKNLQSRSRNVFKNKN